jgi:hypothetical protein
VPGEGVLPGCVSHLQAMEKKSSTAWRLSGEVNVKGGDGDAHDEQPPFSVLPWWTEGASSKAAPR